MKSKKTSENDSQNATPEGILETLRSFCCHDNLEAIGAFRRQKYRDAGDFAVPAVPNKGRWFLDPTSLSNVPLNIQVCEKTSS